MHYQNAADSYNTQKCCFVVYLFRYIFNICFQFIFKVNFIVPILCQWKEGLNMPFRKLSHFSQGSFNDFFVSYEGQEKQNCLSHGHSIAYWWSGIIIRAEELESWHVWTQWPVCGLQLAEGGWLCESRQDREQNLFGKPSCITTLDTESCQPNTVMLGQIHSPLFNSD